MSETSTTSSYFGQLTYTIPYTTSGITQYFDNRLDFISGSLSGTVGTNKKFTFMAIGASRVKELKKYGTNTYSGITTGNTFSGSYYTGYTLDGLHYMDFTGSYTMITGSIPNYYASGSAAFQNPNYVTGNTTQFATEYVVNNMLTRNEHFLGFMEQPRVYSDVFVERGKQGVMEMNLRLGEIDNMGELDIYGNGFFNVKK
jgi:hypothetical protein